MDYSGSPRDGQSFAGSGIADPPPANQLGGYEGPGGWFNAVQIQANAWGDNNLGDWAISQTAAVSGTLSIRSGKSVTTVLDNIPWHNDNPDPRAVYAGAGAFGTPNIDWLDTPGQGRVVPRSRSFPNGGTVVGANLTLSFTSSLVNRVTGGSCSVSWSFQFSLSNPGDKWKMW